MENQLSELEEFQVFRKKHLFDSDQSVVMGYERIIKTLQEEEARRNRLNAWYDLMTGEQDARPDKER